ncbi:hypothetical protein NKG05_11945 [Oerskovia sp. M15]
MKTAVSSPSRSVRAPTTTPGQPVHLQRTPLRSVVGGLAAPASPATMLRACPADAASRKGADEPPRTPADGRSARPGNILADMDTEERLAVFLDYDNLALARATTWAG